MSNVKKYVVSENVPLIGGMTVFGVEEDFATKLTLNKNLRVKLLRVVALHRLPDLSTYEDDAIFYVDMDQVSKDFPEPSDVDLKNPLGEFIYSQIFEKSGLAAILQRHENGVVITIRDEFDKLSPAKTIYTQNFIGDFKSEQASKLIDQMFRGSRDLDELVFELRELENATKREKA